MVGPEGFALRPEAGGWRIVGDVDCAVENDLRAALASACAADTGDVHLLLDSLGFIDAAGARVLVQAARQLEPRRLVLHGLAAGPRKVFRLTGFDATANLAIEES